MFVALLATCVLWPAWPSHIYCRSWAAESGNRYYIPYETSLCEENNLSYNHIPKLHHCILSSLKQEGPVTRGNTVPCCFIREPDSQLLLRRSFRNVFQLNDIVSSLKNIARQGRRAPGWLSRWAAAFGSGRVPHPAPCSVGSAAPSPPPHYSCALSLSLLNKWNLLKNILRQ